MAMTMSRTENDQVVDRFLAAIEAGGMPSLNVFTSDAVLDATVPNWRFTVKGGEAVRSELARWYAESGELEDVSRTALPGGALVTFTLRWEERGVPHAAHQAHVLSIEDGRIEIDQVWCGGRWSAALLAEMAGVAGG
jgi:ketosteroid isomerase-like protein